MFRRIDGRLLLDMDGVIVDFAYEALRVLGQEGLYERPEHLGKCKFINHLMGESDETFWKKLKGDTKFWTNIPPTPEFDYVMKFIEQTFTVERTCICTSPALWNYKDSVEGKLLWLDKYAPEYKPKIMFTRNKEYAASDDALLVDDVRRNIKSFQENKGHGIMVPRPWNHLYKLYYEKIQNNPSYIYDYLMREFENL